MTKTLDRWMPLHIADYRKDTLFLTTLQHGAYMLLLMASWEIGPLDDSEAFLSSIAKVDLKTWRKDVWPTIKRFFSKADDGKIFQKRLSEERDKAERISEIRRKNGRVGGSKPKANAKANAEANACEEYEGNSLKTDQVFGVLSGDGKTVNNSRGLAENGQKVESKTEANASTNAKANAEAPSRDSLHTSSLRSDVPPVAPPAKPDPRGHRLPEDWQPSHEDRSYALSLGLNPTEVAEVFRNYWHDLAGAKARKVSWSGTWKNWCRQDASKRGTAKAATGKPQSPLSQQFERMQRQYGDRTVA